MHTTLVSRRTIALGLTLLPGLGAHVYAEAPAALKSPGDAGEIRTSEAIHQEINFKATRAKVFEALMNSSQFDAITRLSDAVALMSAANAKPTQISRDVGGDFTLFGGYITGLNLEVIPAERLVQSWRTRSWGPGDYSIARFVLLANGPDTKLIFDHQAFPHGEAAHLAPGWHSHYWDPLAKFLAQ